MPCHLNSPFPAAGFPPSSALPRIMTTSSPEGTTAAGGAPRRSRSGRARRRFRLRPGRRDASPERLSGAAPRRDQSRTVRATGFAGRWTTSWSVEFRRTSWMRPSMLASVSTSAWAGSTSRVTTGRVMAGRLGVGLDGLARGEHGMFSALWKSRNPRARAGGRSPAHPRACRAARIPPLRPRR